MGEVILCWLVLILCMLCAIPCSPVYIRKETQPLLSLFLVESGNDLLSRAFFGLPASAATPKHAAARGGYRRAERGESQGAPKPAAALTKRPPPLAENRPVKSGGKQAGGAWEIARSERSSRLCEFPGSAVPNEVTFLFEISMKSPDCKRMRVRFRAFVLFLCKYGLLRVIYPSTDTP